MDSNKIICENCGAAMNTSDAKCPFCGHLNEIGAENAYMNELYETEEEMAELVDEKRDDIVEEAKKSGRYLGKVMVAVSIVLLVIGLLIGGNALFIHIMDLITDAHNRNAIAWQRENFPKLDAMYEEEDYEGITAFYSEANKDYQLKDKQIYRWKHNEFINCYNMYMDICLFENVEMTQDNAQFLLYNCLWFYYRQYELCLEKFSERDMQHIEGEYREKALEVLHNKYKRSDEELDAVFPRLTYKDNPERISYENFKRYANEVYKQLN